MVRAVNFKSSRENDFNGEYEFSPEDVADKIPAELGFENIAEDKKAEFMKDFARLYTFKDRFDSSFEAENTHFEKKKLPNGEDLLYLVVDHMKPSDLSMAVSNGQLVLKSMENMTPDKYQDLAKFCWMNNISDISFPDNVDEVFKQQFQQAYNDEENHAVLGYGNSAEDKKEQAEVDEEVRRNKAAAGRIAEEAVKLPPEQQDEFIHKETQKLLAEKEKQAQAAEAGKEEKKDGPDLSKIEKNMKTFMEVRSAKKKDSCYFKTHTWGGWLHYRIYASPDQRASDGLWDDKSKSFKSNYEIDLKFKNDNGNLCVRYALPGDKEIPGKYADEIVSMMKAQGYLTIDFGNLTDSDKGTFRKACGQAGVLPTFNLGEKHARGMLAAAADNKLVDLAGYKKRMANKLRKQVQKSGKPMEDKDNKGVRGVILECEAENGIVSKDIHWTEDDLMKALKIARDNLSDTDLLEFKKELSETLIGQMEAENSFNNQNPLKKQAEKLANEVAYKPFADAFDKIQEDIKTISEGSKDKRAKAEDVIGAMDTAGELSLYFSEYKDKPLREFVEDGRLNLAEEQKAFAQAFPMDKYAGIKFKDLSSDQLVQLYEIMKAENVKKAAERLEEDTRGKSGQSFDTAVKDNVSTASSKLKNIVKTLRDYGYRDVSAVDVGAPAYVRPDGAGKQNAQQNNQNNWRRGGGRGGR